MDRAVLLTVTDDMTAMWSMRFVAGFFPDKKHLEVCVLYVAPSGYSAKNEETRIVLSDHEVRKGREIVETARQWLVEHGFSDAKVKTKVLSTQYGVVKDLVSEARKGLYDAVVVGRRYLDWMEMLYTTSVSRGILWEDVDFPVWVCNEPDSSRQGVLLCADGSAPVAHMADHVGFMLGAVPDRRVTILHLRTPGVSAEDAVEEARQRILDNGIEASRISTLITAGQDKVGTILRIAHEGDFAVVAVGRRPDLPESLVRRVLTRSVSLGLHENVNKFSLWVCR
ncbi:MAG: universal stress protein [Halodesulfovibrio sp.]